MIKTLMAGAILSAGLVSGGAASADNVQSINNNQKIEIQQIEHKFSNKQEFWLSKGNPIKYGPYLNNLSGVAELKEDTQTAQVVFEFYDLKGSLAYVTTATMLNSEESKQHEFTASVKHLEEGSYSVKVKVINAKVAPKTIQFSHVE